jgi:hypothetical protein
MGSMLLLFYTEQHVGTKGLVAQWLLVLKLWIKQWPQRRMEPKANNHLYIRNTNLFKQTSQDIFVAMTAIAMGAETEASTKYIMFDVDYASDFVSDLLPTNKVVRGFGGSKTTNVMQGTLQWKWVDDQGRTHKFTKPNANYVPQGRVRLLSPQHWAKSVEKCKQQDPCSPICETYSDCVILRWNQRECSKTVPLDPITNVATMAQTADYTKFHAFCSKVNTSIQEEGKIHYVMNSLSLRTPILATHRRKTKTYSQQNQTSTSTDPISFVTAESEVESGATTASVEFLPKKIQAVAKRGILPRKLVHYEVPICTTCMYGKATCKQWRSKTSNNANEANLAIMPGECVSVDQLVSLTQGLIAQITQPRTKRRYNVATVFVDQATGLGFVHLQKMTTAEKTLESKQSFEAFARNHGVKVQHYNADNGIFKMLNGKKPVQMCTKY